MKLIRLPIGGVSKFKGVSKHHSSERWIARIKMKGLGHKHIGCFKTEEEAAKAYNEKAKELFGDFAYLNPV